MTRILRSSAPSPRTARGAMLLLLGCLLAGLLAGCGGGTSAVSANSKGVISLPDTFVSPERLGYFQRHKER